MQSDFGTGTHLYVHTHKLDKPVLWSKTCNPHGWEFPTPVLLPLDVWQPVYHVLPLTPNLWPTTYVVPIHSTD